MEDSCRSSLFVGHALPQVTEFVNLDDLDMRTKRSANLHQVGRYVEHPAVVMSHQPQPGMAERMDHPGGVEPFLNLLPALGIVMEYPGDLVKWNSSPVEDIGQFWHGARGAVCQPLGGHLHAAGQGVETACSRSPPPAVD